MPRGGQREIYARDVTSSSCSFCGKSQDHVKMLIGGPNGVFICNDCVSLAADGLEQSGIALSPVVETDRRDLGGGRTAGQCAVIRSDKEVDSNSSDN